MAGERTLNFGADETDARWQIEDTGDGGDLVLARDLDSGNVALFKYNQAAGQFEFAGPVDAGGNDISNVGTLTSTAVNTDVIVNVADYIIGPNDGLTSIINGMSANETALVAPRASYNATTTLSPPNGASIVVPEAPGRTGAPSTTITKDFNGTLLSMPDNGLTLRGVRLDGNKGTYTGDNITAPAGSKEHYFQRVHSQSAAGDAMVLDGTYFSLFERCRFGLSDGAGLRHIQTTSSEASQNTYVRCQFSKNGGPGVVFDDTFVHTERYAGAVVAQNGDAGFYSRSDAQNMVVSGLIEANDGPALLLDEKSDGSITQQRGWALHPRMVNNNANASGSSVDSPGTRNVGAVHVQNTTLNTTTIYSPWVNVGTDADVVVSTYSDYGSSNRSHFWQIGGAVGGGYSAYAHLEGTDHNAVLMVTPSDVPVSLTSGSNGSGYNYGAAGGTAL